MESKNAALELALTNAKKETEDSIVKLREVEQKSSLLQENVKRCLWLFILGLSYCLKDFTVLLLLLPFINELASGLPFPLYLVPRDLLCPKMLHTFGSLEAKLSNLEHENQVLRQKALNVSPRSNRTGLVKAFSDVSFLPTIFKSLFLIGLTEHFS